MTRSYKIRTKDMSPRMVNDFKLVTASASITKWVLTPYARRRAEEREISYSEILHAIHNGGVLEFQFTNNQERLLIRDGMGTCVSIDINTKQIVTAYKNSVDDNHATLNEAQYISGWQLSFMLLHYSMIQDEKERTGTYPAGLIDGREIRRRIKE